jgi:hypothetical protein
MSNAAPYGVRQQIAAARWEAFYGIDQKRANRRRFTLMSADL